MHLVRLRGRHDRLRHGRETHRQTGRAVERGRRYPRYTRHTSDCLPHSQGQYPGWYQRQRPGAAFAQRVPAEQKGTGREFQAHRGGVEQDSRTTAVARGGRKVCRGESTLPTHDHRRPRRVLRPPLHTAATPQIQKQANPSLRDDQTLGEYPPGLFRWMRLLHHQCPSGQIHSVQKQGEHPEGGEASHAVARLQRLSKRPGGTVGQYVRHGGQKQKHLREMQASVVHSPANLSQPEHRSLEAARHLSCRRPVARHQEKLHRQWCALRSATL